MKLIIFFLILSNTLLYAQKSINMATAIDRVRMQHPTILQQDLYVQQQTILKNSGKTQAPLGVGYMLDEFGVAGWGVHSLYIQQNFNMPQVAKTTSVYQEEVAKAGDLQKKASQKQLELYTASLYQQLLFFKSQQKLNSELLVIYKKINELAKKRAELGDTGDLPILASQNATQQLELQQMGTIQNYGVQFALLKQILLDSSLTDIADTALVAIKKDFISNDLENHPLVQQIDQNMVVNQAQSQVLKSQLLPQLFIGVQTQIVDRTFPNFGGQLGVNVPIFNKGVKSQVQANNLNVKILEQNKIWQLEQLQSQERIAIYNIQQLEQQIFYLENQVLPTIQKQQNLLEKSYQLGEIDYWNVLQNLQQIINTRQTYLQLVFQLNLAWLQYDYLGAE